MQNRFFNKSLEYLDNEDTEIKIAVLNLIQNLVWKGSNSDSDSKLKKKILEMDVKSKLEKMKEEEPAGKVKTFIENFTGNMVIVLFQ